MPTLDTRFRRSIYRFFILFLRESEPEIQSRGLKKKTCRNKKTAKNAKAAEVVDVDRLVFATVVALKLLLSRSPAYAFISRLSEEEPCSQKQKEKPKKDQQAKKPAKSSQQTEDKKGDAKPYVVIIWFFFWKQKTQLNTSSMTSCHIFLLFLPHMERYTFHGYRVVSMVV